MKKCTTFFLFIFFLVCLAPYAQAITFTKCEALRAADKHKKQAIAHLMKAENKLFYLSDLGSREQMKTLLASTIASASVSSPKDKLLTVGLALIAHISCNAYERYCEMRTHMYESVYNFEMMNFYHDMSIRATTQSSDQGTNDFFRGIDDLTKAEIVVECIAEGPEKRTLSSYIAKHRKYILNDFLLAKKLTMATYEECLFFCENFYEVAYNVEDEHIRCFLGLLIYSYISNIAAALRQFEHFTIWPDDIYDMYISNYTIFGGSPVRT